MAGEQLVAEPQILSEAPTQAPSTITLRYANELRDVPVENAEAAMAAGYEQVSDEEISHWDSLQGYQAETSGLGQAVEAFTAGALSGALSLPAMASNLIPGVDGQSGHQWLATAKAMIDGSDDPEKAAEDLRVIAESSRGFHFAGEVAGSLAGSAGIGSAASWGTKAGGKLAAALSTPGAVTAGITAENIGASIAMANEDAFVHNRPLTAETAMMAAAYGGFGPLALVGAGKALRAGGKRAAAAIDDVRVARAEAKAADDYNSAVAGQSAAYEEVFDKAYRQYDREITTEARRLSRQNKERFTGTLDERKAALGALKEEIKKGNPFVPPDPIGPAPTFRVNEPVRLSNLFGPRPEALKTMKSFAQSFEDKALEGRRISDLISKGAQNSVTKETRRALGMDYLGNLRPGGSQAKRIAFDTVVAPMTGAITGNVVNRFGAKGAGMFFSAAAAGLRGISNSAAKAALRGPRAVSPAALATSVVSRTAWRSRVQEAYEGTVQEIGEATAHPDIFAEKIGETFGNFSTEQNNIIPDVTAHYGRAFKYLKDEMPASRPINPAVPSMGMIRPSPEKQASYLRKVAAVKNPLTLLEELENGNVSRDTVSAVSAVYPTLYMDMVQEVTSAIAANSTSLTRHQAMLFDAFLGGNGAVFAAQSGRYMAGLQQAYDSVQVQYGDQGGGVSKPGRPTGSPTMGQQYKTASATAADTVYGDGK